MTRSLTTQATAFVLAATLVLVSWLPTVSVPANHPALASGAIVAIA